MKEALASIASHPGAVVMAALATLFLCYFMFKKIVKLGLFLLLIALAVGGYYYYKTPAQAPRNLLQTIEETRDKSARLLETGKHAYRKGRELYEKSKELTRDVGDFLKKTEEKQLPEEPEKQ